MRILFKEISFRNILHYGNQITKFPLVTGMNLIVGKNGSGKSTLLEALCFCLYGKPYRDIKLADLVNNKNKKGLQVTVSLERDGVPYVISRGLKPDSLRITKNGEEVRVESHKSLIQEQIDQILGVNYNLFRNIISLSSLYNKPFLSLPLNDRRTLLENIFGIKVFGEVLKKVKKRLSVIKGDYQMKIQSRDMKETTLRTLVEQKGRIQASLVKFQMEKTGKLESLRGRLDSLRVEGDEKEPEKITLNPGVEERIVELEKLIARETFNQSCCQSKKEDAFPEFAKFPSLNAQREKIQENIKKTSFFESTVRELEMELRGVNFKISEVERVPIIRENLTSVSLKSKRDRLVEVKSEAKRLEGYLKTLKGEGGVCSVCGQTIDDGHKENEEKRIRKTQAELKDEFTRLNVEIGDELDDLFRREEGKRATSLSGLVSERGILEEKVKVNSDIVKKMKEENLALGAEVTMKEIEIQDGKKVTWEMIFKGVNERLQFYREEHFRLVQDIRKRESREMEIKSFREKKRHLQTVISDLENQIKETDATEFNFDIGELEATISKTEMEAKTFDTQAMGMSKEIGELEALKGCLDDDGVRRYFFAKVLKTFNQLVNSFLDRFGLGVRVLFDDTFNVVIKDGRGERVYESFSAGEQCRINLSITLSFMELNASLNSFNCNLQVFDEIFDSGMDDEGMEIVLEKMKEMADLKGRSCYVISHKSVDNSPFIDSIVKVKKVNGFSKLEV